jgi:hypothetical protein
MMHRRLRQHVRQTEPEVLRIIGEESQHKSTDKLTSRQIERLIKSTRASKRKRRPK